MRSKAHIDELGNGRTAEDEECVMAGAPIDDEGGGGADNETNTVEGAPKQCRVPHTPKE